QRRRRQESSPRRVLEMRRPVPSDEQREKRRGGDRVRRMIGETNRQEPEDERTRVAPEPEILMQRVQSQDEKGGGHGRYTTTSCTLLPQRGRAPPARLLRRRARRSMPGCAKSWRGISTPRPAVPSGSTTRRRPVG